MTEAEVVATLRRVMDKRRRRAHWQRMAAVGFLFSLGLLGLTAVAWVGWIVGR